MGGIDQIAQAADEGIPEKELERIYAASHPSPGMDGPSYRRRSGTVSISLGSSKHGLTEPGHESRTVHAVYPQLSSEQSSITHR